MDSDQGKLFIGGISWETTEDKLREYFGKYGEVMQAVIMRDKISGRPRGFGFVVFSDPSLVDHVLQDKHSIDGRVVEAKRAMSREEQQNTSSRTGNPTSGRSMGGSGGSTQKTKKIFVGGLPPTLSEEGFRKYFEAYGSVTDVVVMYDQNTQRPRGFGFISFDSEDAVDRVLHKTFHDLGGKLVEVKRAMPKDAISHGSGGGRPMGAGGGGSGYQQYGGPNLGSGGYEGRMDGSRYMGGPQSGGGFPPYGSSGYGAHSYGYGAGSNGVSYGGYGVGGYGGPGGGYGNPNAATGGYPGGPRSPWSSQPPSGYGSAGYGGNAGYGTGSGQSPSGSGGYGNQGYGYGGYAGSSEYISRGGGGGGGGGGGDQHGSVSGYIGGGYGDAGGGYPSSWKSDPSQGGGYGPGQSGYGGYGGGPSRQSQQQ